MQLRRKYSPQLKIAREQVAMMRALVVASGSEESKMVTLKRMIVARVVRARVRPKQMKVFRGLGHCR